jgi:geranylgeranylglycerol-phosphate geranylgeranyltransferase
VNAFIELVRPANFALSAAAVWLGYALGAGAGISPAAAYAMLAAALIGGGGQAINDFFDGKADAGKNKKKPIPSGRVKAGKVKAFAFALFAAGLALAWLVNVAAFAIAVAASVSLYSYSAFLAGKKWLGNWVVAGNTALLFVFGASITGDYAAVAPLALAALFANAGREVTKDLEDVKADKGFKKTLPLAAGKGWAEKIALYSLLSACVFASWPALSGPASFFALVALADLAALNAARLLLKKRYGPSQKWFKIAMLCFLVAYAATTISV